MSARIGVAGLIWASSILLSRVIGIVREALIGRTLGGGAVADAYWAAFVVPDFLNYLLAGGALSIVFIPIYGSYLAASQRERAASAFSVIATTLATVTVTLVFATSLLLPQLVGVVAPGFDAAQRQTLVQLTRIILPAQVFHLVGGLLGAVLLAEDLHLVPALSPLVYTLGVVTGGVVGRSAQGFAWGVLAGSFLGPFLLPLVSCLRRGLVWRPVWDLRHPDLVAYVVRSLPIMVSWSIVVVDDWFLRREGSLVGEGVVSVLAYAKTLMRVPMGVFGLAAGQAAYPTLTRLASQRRWSQMQETLWSTLRITLLLAWGSQVVLTVSGYDLAASVFGRQRFSPSQLHQIAGCLVLMSLGLGAWAAHPVLARGFYAMGITWVPALVGTAVSVSSYPFYVLARRTGGAHGLAVMSALAVTSYVVALAVVLRRFLGRRATPTPLGLAPLVARGIPSMAGGVGLGAWVAGLLPPASTTLGSLLRACGCGAAGVGAFVGLSWVLGTPEVREAGGHLTRLVRRRAQTAPGQDSLTPPASSPGRPAGGG